MLRCLVFSGFFLVLQSVRANWGPSSPSTAFQWPGDGLRCGHVSTGLSGDGYRNFPEVALRHVLAANGGSDLQSFCCALWPRCSGVYENVGLGPASRSGQCFMPACVEQCASTAS